MRSNGPLLKPLLLTFALLALPACLNPKYSETEINKAKARAELALNARLTTSTVGVTLNPKSAHVICGFLPLDSTDTYFQINCAVAVDVFGQMLKVDSIEPKFKVTWSNPESVFGASINKPNCLPGADQLSTVCEVTLSKAVPTSVQMQITIEDTVGLEQVQTNSMLWLPNSVETIGRPPQAGVTFFPQEKPRTALPESFDFPAVFLMTAPSSAQWLGWQPTPIVPTSLYLDDVTSVCNQGNRLLIASHSSIYELQQDLKTQKWVLELYAGSNANADRNDLSNRMRISFGDGHNASLKLACRPNRIVVSDKWAGRIVELHDMGPVVPLAQTNSPGAVALNSDGSALYFTQPDTQGSFQIDRLETSGITEIFTSSGVQSSSGVTQILKTVSSLISMDDGSLIATDPVQHVVRRIDSSGLLSAFAGTGTEGRPSIGELAIQSPLSSPVAVTRSADGGIYVADSGNFEVLKITVDGKLSLTAGTGKKGPSVDPGPISSASMGSLEDLVVGDPGYLLIADGGELRQLDSKGTISTIAGKPAISLDPQTLPGKVTFSPPPAVALANDGTIYLSDDKLHAIRVVSSNDAVTTTVKIIAGTGKAGYSGDGKPAVSAELNSPLGLALSANGTLFIADSGNAAIRQINKDLTIGSFVSNPSTPLRSPSAIAVSANGTVAVSDTLSEKIWFFNSSRALTGSVTLNPKSYVSSLSYGAGGYLYFVDKTSKVVCRINSKGKIEKIISASSMHQSFSPESVSADTNVTGEIYVIDSVAQRLYQFQVNPSGKFSNEMLLTQGTGTDCGFTVLSGKTQIANMDLPLLSSPAQMCVGRLKAVSVPTQCSNGKKSLVVSEGFTEGNQSTDSGGLVRLQIPCY